MAKRNRYKQMEELLTKILLADAAIFVLYLIFAGTGVTALKAITAIIAILVSGLSLAFLYMNGEIKKRRSRWMVAGFGAVLVCLLVSLVVHYPSPAPVKATPVGNSASSSAADPSEALTDTTGAPDTTGASEVG